MRVKFLVRHLNLVALEVSLNETVCAFALCWPRQCCEISNDTELLKKETLNIPSTTGLNIPSTTGFNIPSTTGLNIPSGNRFTIPGQNYTPPKTTRCGFPPKPMRFLSTFCSAPPPTKLIFSETGGAQNCSYFERDPPQPPPKIHKPPRNPCGSTPPKTTRLGVSLPSKSAWFSGGKRSAGFWGGYGFLRYFGGWVSVVTTLPHYRQMWHVFLFRFVG